MITKYCDNCAGDTSHRVTTDLAYDGVEVSLQCTQCYRMVGGKVAFSSMTVFMLGCDEGEKSNESKLPE